MPAKKPSSPKVNVNYWQRTVGGFGIAAEIANVGIVVEIIAKWVPAFAVLAVSGPIAYIMAIADPLIYFFRAMIRLTRIIGRNFFNAQFEEEKNGIHKYQTVGDLISLVFFTLAVLMFSGLIIASPVGLTIAWTLGLCGLLPICYFDHAWPEQKAKEKYETLKKSGNTPPEELEAALKDYRELKTSRRLFIALLIGLSFLLICGSAAVFAPPALVPILAITSKIASIVLGGIAIGRFCNWLFSGDTKKASKSADSATKDKKAEPLSPPSTPKLSPSFKPKNKLSSSQSESLPSRDGLFGSTPPTSPSLQPENNQIVANGPPPLQL